MSTDPTQQQSTEARERAQDLSRKRNRPPIEVEGYSARKFLGAGAYGEVWVAVDQNTGRKVAIKFYTHRGGLDWSLLSSEVEKLVFLSADRYVVQLLDVGWDADPPYYVMEYVENGSLEDLLKERGTLPVGEAVEMFREISTGLLHAHGKGVLHCDLKPANILLDQDHKPRLADFGQSRLSHEQTPALGTLFYMAPEQASLDAVPDSRWDVYALGAILYCMLTGESPHRSDDAVSEIDSAPALEERLEKYREFIKRSPPLTAHRHISGVDRPLVDIIDRCLAYNPDQRFNNVQSVLDGLQARDAMRDRRPLLILGLLGPLLFLLLAGWSGYDGYRRSVRESEALLRSRAVESNQFAAAFVAEAVARRIEGYFRSVQEAATDPTIRATIHRLVEENESAQLVEQLDGGGTSQKESVIRQLRTDPDCELLHQMLEARDSEGDEIVSWFITNRNGTQIASIFDDPVSSTLGKNYAWRSYFSGLSEDLRPGQHPPPDQHVKQTQLSAVFLSQATGTWKVAVSTPVWKETTEDNMEPEFLGIVALTVELGGLGDLLSDAESSEHQFNVLIAKENGSATILQHPLLEQLKDDKQFGVIGEYSKVDKYKIDLSNWNEDSLYIDPLSKHQAGSSYASRWVAAKRDVADTRLAVIVQENYDYAVNPVQQLGDSLARLGIIALSGLLAIVTVLWWMVVRALRDPNERARKQGGKRAVSSSLHSMETIELPKQMQR